MEQRAAVRFAIDQPVAVWVLGGTEVRETALVRNVSEAGVQLVWSHSIPAGSAVKIELDNALALGEVVYCIAEGDQWVFGIKLEHVLNGLAELQRKLLEFAGEPIPETTN
ncbi:MAG TPA: PilZ domain-containing protein [Bryobacteraceae bacterium]|jgi:hypothetical protein